MEQRICPICGKTYMADPKRLKYGRQTSCSKECSYLLRSNKITKSVTASCTMCGKIITKAPSQMRSKSGLTFCSPACHYTARSTGILKMPLRGPYRASQNQIADLPVASSCPTPTPLEIDNIWGHWLAGMVAGDGSFCICDSKRGSFTCMFTISLRDDDTPILETLHKITGIGHIAKKGAYLTSKPATQWVVYSKTDCLRLLSIFDRYPIRAKRHQEYEIWKKAVIALNSESCGKGTWDKLIQFKGELDCIRRYQVNPEPSDIKTDNPDFGHWLAGFIDAEGCFRVHKIRKGNYYGCAFSLKLRDDDTPILQTIQKQTEIGTLRPDVSRTGNSKPCMTWEVGSMGDCQRLVHFLDTYPLRSKKMADFAIWKQAVACWVSESEVRHKNRDWAQMIAYKSAIEDARLYRPPV